MDVAILGASGGLGALVRSRIEARGHRVVAIARADARDPVAIACTTPSVIVNCAGASVAMARGKGWRGYGAVDVPIGLAAVGAAHATGARLVYVGVAHAPELATCAYVQAHERVADAMRELPRATVVRATGFFSAFAAIVPMGRRGRLVDVGDGARETNPIHEEDLADLVVETALDPTAPREIAAGGPDILTRRQLFEIVAAAAAKRYARPVKISGVPIWLAATGTLALRCLHPRIGQFARFAVALARHDNVAPKLGTSRFADYLA